MIGVTGGIGSGKSTVCKIFEVLGAKVYYADDRAKALMESDSNLVSSISELFGGQAYEHGKLNRAYLADKIYKDDSLREKLNQLVHPAVAIDAKHWLQNNQEASLLLKEAALLFETGSYKYLAKTILVTAPAEIRIERVVARDAHRTSQDVQAIISKQMADDEKSAMADYVIVNDGSESVIQQVMEVYHELIVA